MGEIVITVVDRRDAREGYVFAYDFDLADRMRKALRVADLSVNEAAERMNVSRNTIGNWLSGRSKPGTEQLVVFAAVTGAPYEWLRTGHAPA